MTQPSLPIEPGAALPWSGRLSELPGVLTTEAMLVDVGTWRFRQLKGGALVALQLDDDGRRVIRIARADRPATTHAGERWALELRTFEKHLGIGTWLQAPEADASGVAVRYVELWEGEVMPGQAKCGRCGTEIKYDPTWGRRQRCETCARLDGDDETREIHARLAGEAGESSTTTQRQAP